MFVSGSYKTSKQCLDFLQWELPIINDLVVNDPTLQLQLGFREKLQLGLNTDGFGLGHCFPDVVC